MSVRAVAVRIVAVRTVAVRRVAVRRVAVRRVAVREAGVDVPKQLPMVVSVLGRLVPVADEAVDVREILETVVGVRRLLRECGGSAFEVLEAVSAHRLAVSVLRCLLLLPQPSTCEGDEKRRECLRWRERAAADGKGVEDLAAVDDEPSRRAAQCDARVRALAGSPNIVHHSLHRRATRGTRRQGQHREAVGAADDDVVIADGGDCRPKGTGGGVGWCEPRVVADHLGRRHEQGAVPTRDRTQVS